MPMKSVDISLRYLRTKSLEFEIRKLFIELEVTRTVSFILVSVTLSDVWTVYTTVKFVVNKREIRKKKYLMILGKVSRDTLQKNT